MDCVDFGVVMTRSLMSGWRYRALLVSIVVAVAGYLAFSLWGGIHDVAEALAGIGVGGIAIMLLLSALNYALRFKRWQSYLAAVGHRVPWQANLRIYVAGFALTITPGKAGEAFRGVLLKRWGVPYTHSFAAFVSERLSDLVAIVFLALFGLTLYPQLSAVVAVGCAGALFGLWLLTQSAPVRGIRKWAGDKPGVLHRGARTLAHMLSEAHACHRPSLLVTATILSLLAWGAEALAFYCMLRWMGLEVALPFAVFVYAAAMLAGALSFLPGGLGGAEAVMVAMLLWQGVPQPEAVAATVLIRLTTLWYAVLLGIIAVFMSRNERVAG